MVSEYDRIKHLKSLKELEAFLLAHKDIRDMLNDRINVIEANKTTILKALNKDLN